MQVYDFTQITDSKDNSDSIAFRRSLDFPCFNGETKILKNDDSISLSIVALDSKTTSLREILNLAYFVNFSTDKDFILPISLTSKYFENIIKLKALHFILEQIKSQSEFNYKICGVSALDEYALTHNKSNSLRLTTHIMSALNSGCDFILARPYDALEEESSSEAQRLMEMTFHVLKEESHFGKIYDPYQGSFLIETKTENLVDQILEKFREYRDISNYEEFLERLRGLK